MIDLGVRHQRDGPRLVEALGVKPHLGVRVDERLEGTVLFASLAQVDAVIADVDLGVDHYFADRADAFGVLHEHFVTIYLRRTVRLWCGQLVASYTGRRR